jgi:hypothetical protein
MKTPTMGQGLRDVCRVEVGAEEYHQMRCEAEGITAPYTSGDGNPMVPFVSCSMLKAFSSDPQTCFDEYVARTSRREPSAAMQFGIRLERSVMYGENPSVAVIPNEVLQARRKPNSEEVTYAKSGAPWNEWRERMIAEHGDAVLLLKQEEYDRQIVPLLMARDALQSHEAAAKLLWGEGDPHVTVTAIDSSTGIDLPFKMQLDFVHSRGFLVDLKTCAPSVLENTASLMSRMKDLHYFWQAWIYQHLWMGLTGEFAPFIFVFVSSEAPFRVRVCELDDDWQTLAESQVRDTMSRFSKCWASGVWQPEDYGRIIKLPMPRYAMTSWEDEIRARVSK